MKNIIFIFIAIGLSYSLGAQQKETIGNKLSIDLLFLGGSTTLLDPSHKNKSYISNIGSFESSKGYFYETGIELKRKLKNNSLKTGLYYGYSNATIKGSIPIMDFTSFIICGPIPIALEDMEEESFEAQVRMHRLSVPLSFVKESKNPGPFKIAHEFGVILDLKVQSNFADVEKAIMEVPNFISYHQTESESNYSLPKNIGFRILYGVSASISPKISFASNLKFGIFDTHPIEENSRELSSWHIADQYNNFDRSVFGYFEMGFGLKYKLK